MVTSEPIDPAGPSKLDAILAVLIVAVINDALMAELADVTVSTSGGIPKGYALIN